MKSGIFSIIAIVLCALFLYFFDYNMHKTGGSGQLNKEEKKFVNIYTSRKEELLRDIFDKFTQETGIEVNIIYDDAGKLISKLKSERDNPMADLLITTDIMNLEYAKEIGILSHIDDASVFSNIEKHLYDDDHQWVGLTKRARVIVYAKDKINPEDLNDYIDLGDEKWRNKILVTSSKSPYNQSLIAGMLVNNEKNVVENWINDFTKNFARKPQGGETEQIIAVANGIGDLAIVNSYYYGRLMKKNNEINEKTGIFFPNQQTSGTHVNISGIALVKNASNEKNALALIKFMLQPSIQSIYAYNNCEFPVIKTEVDMPDFMKTWGENKMDHNALHSLFSKNKEMVELIEKFNWQ